MGPRASLDTVAKRKNSCPCQESNPGHLAHRKFNKLSTQIEECKNETQI